MQTATSKEEAEVTRDHPPGEYDKERVPSSHLPELESVYLQLLLQALRRNLSFSLPAYSTLLYVSNHGDPFS